jgi:hypothetical protein
MRDITIRNYLLLSDSGNEMMINLRFSTCNLASSFVKVITHDFDT